MRSADLELNENHVICRRHSRSTLAFAIIHAASRKQRLSSESRQRQKSAWPLAGTVEKSGADTMLVIHDDHFVNFDFRCYPPFCLLIGKEAKGRGVIDPAEIEKITGAVYQKYLGKTSYGSAPAGMPQHVSDWEGGDKPYVYRVDEDLSVRMLKDLLAMGFDMPFTTNGTMDGELVLTQNFLNPKADKSIMLLFTNGYVPPIPHPRRCYELGRAIRKSSTDRSAKC